MNEDIVYEGRRMRPQVYSHPEGGFGARLIIWAGEGTWTHILLPTAHWESEERARSGVAELGRRVIDAESRLEGARRPAPAPRPGGTGKTRPALPTRPPRPSA